MRHKPAQRLSARDFYQKVAGNRFAIVLLDTGFPHYNPELIRHFDEKYPGQFMFGYLDRKRISNALWWQDHFRTPFAPVKRSGDEPDTGYYLFEHGAVVAQMQPSAYMDTVTAAERMVEYFERRVVAAAVRDAPRSGRSEPEAMATRAAPDFDPFEILGVDSEASDADIRAAYKELMKLNHPDKVAHLSPAIRKVAEEQTLQIQMAYEAIRGMRRGSL